jgi:hypothetical protein
LEPSSLFFCNEGSPEPHILLGDHDGSPLPKLSRTPVKEPSVCRNKPIVPFEIQIKPPNSRRRSSKDSYKQIDHNLLNIGQPSTPKLPQPSSSKVSHFSQPGPRSPKSVNFNFPRQRERDNPSPESLVTQSNRILLQKPTIKPPILTITDSPPQFSRNLHSASSTNTLTPNPNNLPKSLHHRYNKNTAQVRKSIAVYFRDTSILEFEGLYSNAIEILKGKTAKEQKDNPMLKSLISESMNS